MGTVRETITIEAESERVWGILADFGGVAAWNPGVVSARLLTAAKGGVGAERRCELKGGKSDYIHERIVGWKEEAALTVEIAGTNQPIRSGSMEFSLTPDGPRTRVTFAMNYTLKFGPLGKLLDRLVVRGQMAASARSILKGLKRHAETSPRAAARVA